MPLGSTVIAPLKAVNVSTGGVHPLVRASMLPRIKAAKSVGIGQQNRAMASQFGPKSPRRANMSRIEEATTTKELGRRPRA